MTQYYNLSGAERLSIELAAELNKRGLQADVVSLYENCSNNSINDILTVKKKGIPNVFSFGLKVHPNILQIILVSIKLRMLICKEKYYCVETSMVIPMIITIWATMFLRVRHIAGLHMVFDKKRDDSVIHKILKMSIFLKRDIHLYAISKYVMNAWRQYLNVKLKWDIQLIYNAIADEYFNAKSDRNIVCNEFGIDCESVIVIYVGRIAWIKGIDILIHALGPVLEKYNMQLLCVGLPDKSFKDTVELLDNLNKISRRECWESRIHFLGYRKDTPKLMASSDLLVHPTRREGFGLTLVEAMATGIPIVSTNVEGIPEVLEKTGSIMVPPDDPAALQIAVINVIQLSKAERAEIVKKGRIRSNEFRIGNRVDAIIKLFDHK
jgi:glycosyltransferase involved in cell wall biosynthesis